MKAQRLRLPRHLGIQPDRIFDNLPSRPVLTKSDTLKQRFDRRPDGDKQFGIVSDALRFALSAKTLGRSADSLL
jgi:hypothetical protein